MKGLEKYKRFRIVCFSNAAIHLPYLIEKKIFGHKQSYIFYRHIYGYCLQENVYRYGTVLKRQPKFGHKSQAFSYSIQLPNIFIGSITCHNYMKG